MADTRESLFGPSPQDIAAAQAQQGQQDAMGWAQLPAGRGAVAAAASAGQAFGNLGGKLMGGQDPAQAKAQRMQAAQQETEAQAQSMGIDLASNPKDYYKVAAQTLHKYGLVDEAQNVISIAQNHDLAERKMQVDEGALGAQTLSAKAAYLKAQGVRNPTTSNILTLVPGGSKNKGAEGAVTIDMTDPQALQKARELQAQGYIDADSLPSPPSPGVTVKLPEMEGAFDKGIGQGASADVISQTTSSAMGNYNNGVINSNRIIDLARDPKVKVGAGAELALAASKALNITGANNNEIIAKTQALSADMAKVTLSNIKTSGLGTGQGFTDKDLKFLERASIGDINFDKDSIVEFAMANLRGQRFWMDHRNKMLNNLDPKRREKMRGIGIDVDEHELPEIPNIRTVINKPKTKPISNAIPPPPKGYKESAEEWAKDWEYMPDNLKTLFQGK